MNSVLWGALGVLFVLALLAFGVFLGWKAREAWQKHTRRAVTHELTEQEIRKLKAEQDAFNGLLNYNTDTAYGLNSDPFMAKEE